MMFEVISKKRKYHEGSCPDRIFGPRFGTFGRSDHRSQHRRKQQRCRPGDRIADIVLAARFVAGGCRIHNRIDAVPVYTPFLLRGQYCVLLGLTQCERQRRHSWNLRISNDVRPDWLGPSYRGDFRPLRNGQ